MRTPFGILGMTNGRRRKHRKKRVLGKSSARESAVVRQITKSVHRTVAISGRCLNSFVRDLQEQRLNLSEERKILHYKRVDACNGYSLIGGSYSRDTVFSARRNESRQIIEMDIREDFSRQEEVIDLTETDGAPPGDGLASTDVEPTVIDLSDGVPEEVINDESDNDEVFVIGTFSKDSAPDKKKPSTVPLSSSRKNLRSLVTPSAECMKRHKQKHCEFKRIDSKRSKSCEGVLWRPPQSCAKVGENVYVGSPLAMPSGGLRPIIIDGSNVAFVHSTCNFSCKRLEICINYFKEKGHKVTAFVPQFRLSTGRSDDPDLLRRLEIKGDVVLTPSKKIDGRNIVPYDDRFIVQTAALKGGIIVTRDNYNDLLRENPYWAETIKYRTLAFTWIDDVLMFPKDPLGEFGPSLEEFLRFH